MREFIDVVMGRWKPETNTHFGGKTEEGPLKFVRFSDYGV